MSFSDRIGLTHPKATLQIDAIDGDLRNCLWEACREFYLRDFGHTLTQGTTFGRILKDLYVNHWKVSSDEIELIAEYELRKLKKHFYECNWFDIYNLIEFLSMAAVRNFRAGINVSIPKPKEYDTAFRKRINFFLEREKSAYRFLGDVLVPITSSLEISEIEEAICLSDKFSGARSHIQHAVRLFGQKPQPDYRNAIKEAMSAVELAARIITGNKKAMLTH